MKIFPCQFLTIKEFLMKNHNLGLGNLILISNLGSLRKTLVEKFLLKDLDSDKKQVI